MTLFSSDKLMHSFRPLNSPLAAVFTLLFVAGTICYAGLAGTPQQWVGTWATAPQLVEPGNNPPAPGLSNNTLRQIFRVSIGGDTLRMRFSNEFSASATTMHAVHIALSLGGGRIDSTTDMSLLFNGAGEVIIAPGATVTSDPFAFPVLPRTDIAVTIYYGSTPSDVTGHPGSRTTSYLLTGDAVSRADFSGAVTTDHWYTINGVDVLAQSPSACVAILGNSITDGRGSTTNLQNRWPDVFSESLLSDSSTRHVGVLNMGIGGNAVLAGGLGPTGVSRFDRDILNPAGVRWIIVFEGVNDIGGVNSASAATTTANNLIAAYQGMIAKAHGNNIRIYGATIMPFKGNGYYNQYSDVCRSTVNQWIRTGNFDAYIDFDKAMRDPTDTTRILSSYQNDGLHPDSAGHATMGQFVDRSLFTGADTVFQPPAGIESFWFEAERFPTVDSKFTIVSDAAASNGKYITVQTGVQSLNSAPADSTGWIVIPFTATTDSTYYVFGRMNCPTFDDDSFWARVENTGFVLVNGLATSGWEWKTLSSYPLTAGDHTFTIGYREDGALLDKICITNSVIPPSGLGEPDPTILGVRPGETIRGYELGQNYPNPFNPVTTIQFSIPVGTNGRASLQVYDLLGQEVALLVNERKAPGNYAVRFDGSNLSSGMYIYRLRTGSFAQAKKMMVVK